MAALPLRAGTLVIGDGGCIFASPVGVGGGGEDKDAGSRGEYAGIEGVDAWVGRQAECGRINSENQDAGAIMPTLIVGAGTGWNASWIRCGTGTRHIGSQCRACRSRVLLTAR